MDAGSSSSSSISLSSSTNHSNNTKSRYPLQEQQLLHPKTSRDNLDRFILNRSAMDFDYAHYMVTEGSKKGKENPNTTTYSSPSRDADKKLLAETFNMNRTRILAFKNKPPIPIDPFPNDYFSAPAAPAATNPSCKPAKPRRYIPQSSERTLDAPDILDDYYLNLLDWGSTNVLSIALGSTLSTSGMHLLVLPLNSSPLMMRVDP